MKYRLWVLGFILVLFVLIGLPAAAQTRAIGLTSIEITNPVLINCDSVTGIIVVQAVVTAYDSGGGVINSAGNPVAFTLTFSTNAGASVVNGTISNDPTTIAALFTPPLTGTVLLTASSGSVTSAPVAFNCGGTPIVLPDGRLNWGSGDLVNALYRTYDDSGSPAISVWEIQAGNKGIYIGTFTYALIQPYLSAPPVANIELARIGSTSLYALSSGEFQLVVGPDAQGKYYSTLFSGLPAVVIGHINY